VGGQCWPVSALRQRIEIQAKADADRRELLAYLDTELEVEEIPPFAGILRIVRAIVMPSG